MSRATDRAWRGALVAVAVVGVAASLAGCATARSAPRAPAVTVEHSAGSSAEAPAGPSAGTTADTPSGTGTPVTQAPVVIRQDDLDELGAALSDGSALTTEVESDMAMDSTE